MSQEKIKNIIEAALMVSPAPLNVSRLLALFEDNRELQPERKDIRDAIETLQNDFQQHGIELVEVASGFRFQARNEYAEWVNHLFDERPPRYSRALLETLAIIAYRQPITRGEIEDIRGVSVSTTIIKTLQERDWIKVVGHRDVPGKPELLATTKAFLDYFNLKKLSDLPDLADIKDFDSINPDLFEAIEGANESKDDGENLEQSTDLDEETDIDASAEATDTPIEESIVSSEEHEANEECIDDELEESAKVIPFSN